jgi:hypothetical protein
VTPAYKYAPEVDTTALTPVLMNTKIPRNAVKLKNATNLNHQFKADLITGSTTDFPSLGIYHLSSDVFPVFLLLSLFFTTK